jgi:hypothetical protein
MKKILIATKNKDKFVIVVDIFKKIGLQNYEFVNLHDLSIDDNIEETGDITQRAEQKAKFYGNIAKKLSIAGLVAIIGIDDGIKLPKNDNANPNSKEITSGILSGELVEKGDIVWIVRAFVIYVLETGKIVSSTTLIPFNFLGNSEDVKWMDEKYPLSLVLGRVNDFKPVAEISNKESSDYYLKYSKYPLQEMFVKASVL